MPRKITFKTAAIGEREHSISPEMARAKIASALAETHRGYRLHALIKGSSETNAALIARVKTKADHARLLKGETHPEIRKIAEQEAEKFFRRLPGEGLKAARRIERRAAR